MMGLFLLLLKVLAVLLGMTVILLVVTLLLPLGFSVEYHPGRLRILGIYGPFRRVVWSHRLHWPAFMRQRTSFSAPEPVRKEAPDQPPQAASAPEKQQEQTAPPPPLQAENPPSAAMPEKPESSPREPPLPEPEEEEEESSALMKRLERILEVTIEDPKAMAHCVLTNLHWLQKHSLFKIRVRHLNVFWTVTCEDASKTAIAYGAEMTAFNTMLALAQQVLLLQSDRLWLEPDFTGTRRSERHISCTVSASAILMFHLLYRIWKDPVFQPAAQPEPQTN